AIVPATAQHTRPLGAQPRLHRPEPLVLLLPVLRPDRRRDGPQRGRRGRAAPTPRREASLKTPAQPGQRLGQMEQRREETAAIVARLGIIRYHSGVCGGERRRLGAGWYGDWKGAPPHAPWYTRGRRQPSAWVSPLP